MLLGFVTPRIVGGSVVRHRLRRRLRAAARAVLVEAAPGSYLIGGSTDAVRAPFPALIADLQRAACGAVRKAEVDRGTR